MISYDPEQVPQLDPVAVEEAEESGFRPIHIICDAPGAKVGDPGGVSFFAFVHFIPRIGDRISLHDGTVCEVRRIYFKIASRPGSKAMVLVPNVYAVRISPDQEDAG